MKKILVAVALYLPGGCSLDRVFVDAVDRYQKVILPEYENYVKKDPRLDADATRVRLQTATRFRKLVEEAKEY